MGGEIVSRLTERAKRVEAAEKCDEKEQFVASEGRRPYEKLRGAKRDEVT